jgi:hypothetical protein
MQIVRSISLLGALCAVDASAYATESRAINMSFEKCLATIRQTSSDLGVAPINIVETNVMRMVRFPTSDGSVLITCSRPDQRMVLTKSPHR